MICVACAEAADTNKPFIHAECTSLTVASDGELWGKTWCDCQHKPIGTGIKEPLNEQGTAQQSNKEGSSS